MKVLPREITMEILQTKKYFYQQYGSLAYIRMPNIIQRTMTYVREHRELLLEMKFLQN